MRAASAAVLVVLLLAGCSAPTQPPPEEDGPVDLAGAFGLVFVDLETRAIVALGEASVLAWMSPNASIVTWTESTFAIVLDVKTGARDVGPLKAWARVYDNATGLELAESEARVRDLKGPAIHATVPIPPPPAPNTPWTSASDDLAVLRVEQATQGRGACASDIILRAERGERTTGCHLRISSDGRAGWTEGARVRVRERGGSIADLPREGAGDATNGTVVAHENPVFTDAGVVMVRLTGGAQVTSSEIVTEGGEVLAQMAGPRRLAIHDVSADGRFLLVRTFAR